MTRGIINYNVLYYEISKYKPYLLIELTLSLADTHKTSNWTHSPPFFLGEELELDAHSVKCL